MNKALFLLLILTLSGTVFSSEVLNESDRAQQNRKTIPNIYSSEFETQNSLHPFSLQDADESTPKFSLRNRNVKQLFKQNKKTAGPIADFFLNTYSYIGLIFLVLIGLFIGNKLKKSGYFDKTPRYSILAILSSLFILTGLIFALFSLWGPMFFFGVMGLVFGAITHLVISKSNGELKGKGFSIVSIIFGNLIIIATTIIYFLSFMQADF
jgi:hypothetical protein